VGGNKEGWVQFYGGDRAYFFAHGVLLHPPVDSFSKDPIWRSTDFVLGEPQVGISIEFRLWKMAMALKQPCVKTWPGQGGLGRACFHHDRGVGQSNPYRALVRKGGYTTP
jgi:hypothetical protein